MDASYQIIQFTAENLSNLLIEGNALTKASLTKRSLHTNRQAGVLVPIFCRGHEWMVLLSQRSHKLKEHPREISFPGGRMEIADANLTECALRESKEEIGIPPERVNTLGNLSPVETRTGYTVWPTVGIIPDRYPFLLNSEEVTSLLEIPLTWLNNRDSTRSETFLQSDGLLIYRRIYTFNTHLIYGATARILDQLLDICGKASNGSSEMQDNR